MALLSRLGLVCLPGVAVACLPPAFQAENEVSPSTQASVWRGTTPGGGFGSRIVALNEDVYISAPFSGEVFRAQGGEQPIVHAEFGAASFAGSGLALTDTGTLVLGLPGVGDGEVHEATRVAAQGDRVGGVLAARGTNWVTSTREGWRLSNGTIGTLGRRPDALAFDAAGAVLAGASWGEVAVWFGETGILRQAVGDEAGAALLLRPDGSLWVGAPGAGAVFRLDNNGIWTRIFGAGTGRFGAALVGACGSENSVCIGAPAYGDAHQGAVFRWDPTIGHLELLETGDAGDELGTALAVSATHLLVGAPGGAASKGAVLALPLSP